MIRLTVTSPAFKNQGSIPERYTADGDNINPSIEIEGIPENAQSLVIIVDDPDAPNKAWVHWVVWNVPIVKKIYESNIPGVQGLNDFMGHNYGGPSPPSGTHRYFFKVYALDTKLNLTQRARKEEVEKAMEGHTLAMGQLVGIYSRK